MSTVKTDNVVGSFTPLPVINSANAVETYLASAGQTAFTTTKFDQTSAIKVFTKVGSNFVEVVAAWTATNTITISGIVLTAGQKLYAYSVGVVTRKELSVLDDLVTFKPRRQGDIVSIASVKSGWAMNSAFPFPSGGGDFVWDSSSVAAPIYGMVTQVTGVSVGRWKRIYKGAVDVTFTGAIPDGITKCSSAIQIAVDNYKAVYIPPGKFVLDNATTHSLIYTATLVTCGVKITAAQKCVELYGAGESTQLLSEPGVRYNALISMYNVTDRSVHSFNMDGLYDRSGSAFLAAIIGIRQQSIQRCTTHSLRITNFAYHCLAMYGGSHAVNEPACNWNKSHNLYLDGGGQSTLLLYSATWTGLTLPNEYNEFSNIYAMNSHIYFGIEIRKSNNNTFVNVVTNSNQKGGLNLEEGASQNKFTNWVSKFNGYGLHMVSNSAGDIVGNSFNNFDCSDNNIHNVLSFMGAIGNTFRDGHFDRAGTGNGWRSEDTTSMYNKFYNVTCNNNTGEGFLFQNTEYLTNCETIGNGLRGITAFASTSLRRVTSKGNGTDIAGSVNAVIDAEDCTFGLKHGVAFMNATPGTRFVKTTQCGRYEINANVTEEVSAGSMSPLVWRTAVAYGSFCRIPLGSYVGIGFTSLKVSFRVQTDGAARLLRDIFGAGTNINVPAVTGWQWVTYTIPVASLTADYEAKIRYEHASGWMLFDGYQISFV